MHKHSTFFAPPSGLLGELKAAIWNTARRAEGSKGLPCCPPYSPTAQDVPSTKTFQQKLQNLPCTDRETVNEAETVPIPPRFDLPES